MSVADRLLFALSLVGLMMLCVIALVEVAGFMTPQAMLVTAAWFLTVFVCVYLVGWRE